MSPAGDAEALAGRVILVGFEGATPPDRVARAIEERALAGVVLFARNVESAAQVGALLDDVRRRAGDGPPPIAAVDQEGGRVVRIREPLTSLPPARRLGEIDDPGLTETAGRLVGGELGALGFTLNLAPVLDVDTFPSSPVIGDRSYGGSHEVAIRHGLAFARGLRDGGVLPCAKHFPGHGDAEVDSHERLPVVDRPRERLESVEMEPFAAWARTGLGPVMAAHVVYPALDPSSPATASRAILSGELRGRLRFNGAILTDDLEMGAIAEIGGPGPAAVRALRAGADGLLVCRDAEVEAEVRESIAREILSDRTFDQRILRAAARLEPLGRPGRRPSREWIGSEEHAALRDGVLGAIDRAPRG